LAVHNSYNVAVDRRTAKGSSQASKTITGLGKWTRHVRGMAQFVAACIFILAVIGFLLDRSSREAEWPRVHGTIQETRIIADHALQTGWGGQITWKAEYKVIYTVATHEYSVWTDSGIRGQSEADVRLALPQGSPTCRVRYNPQKPEVSVAGCR
jgi:hypothetical protein